MFIGLLPLYTINQATGVWQEIHSAKWFIWAPFFLVFLWEIFGKVFFEWSSLWKTLGIHSLRSNIKKPDHLTSTRPKDGGNDFSFSIILPTFNEALKIPSLLQNIKYALADFEHEILIVDGGSTDLTVELANKHGAITYISDKKVEAFKFTKAFRKQRKMFAFFFMPIKYFQ
jgi:cellulose synthase/poly-beta-1,6-N-acetylglucosamine synthase-like glycosyltransferase